MLINKLEETTEVHKIQLQPLLVPDQKEEAPKDAKEPVATPTNPLQDFIKVLSEPQNLQFCCEVLEVIDESPDYRTIRIARPEGFCFLPGQYLEVKGVESQALKPTILAVASGVDDNYIEITAKPNANPTHANYCLNCGIGESLVIKGPMGSAFPIDLATSSKKVIILGGGTGITALKCLMESMPDEVNCKLIYSCKGVNELLYQEEIAEWQKEGHIISLSREEREGFYHGRITDFIPLCEIDEDTLIFVCGPKELVLDTAKLCVSLGAKSECIYGSLPALAKDGGPVYRGDHPAMQLVIT